MRKRVVYLFVVAVAVTILTCIVSTPYLYTNSGLLTTEPESNLAICSGSSLLGKVELPTLPAVNSSINMMEASLGLSKGGYFSPKNCKPEYKVAIIIPLRNRELHLRTLLSHMHPIWKRQLIEYRVYVINQIDGALFNRGKLLNAGVSEASKDDDYDCYVFHDVDLLLEDDRCLYYCDTEHPRHLAMHMNKFQYKKRIYNYQCSFNGKDIRKNRVMYFGGVSMMTHEQFVVSNGYSNIYWGWGAEDDDLYIRIMNANFSVVNPYGRNCSYSMIKHKRDVGNPKNPGRLYAMRNAHRRRTKDGYNTIKYQVISRVLMLLYTNVTVDIGKPSEELLNFMHDCKAKTCPTVIPLE